MDDARRNYHRLKLRLRRNTRRQKRQVEEITAQADESLNKNVFKRFDRLRNVKRFVFGWTVLVIFIGFGAVWQVRGLDSFYLKPAPVSGGIYREGIIGRFTNANPLFAVSGVDGSVSELVFSGLFKLAPNGELEPDLATGYEISKDGLTYKVDLRKDVKWHDGREFTSKDVIFTYESIADPEVKSPLLSSWADVEVKAINNHSVEFILPNVLSPFHFSLTNGIVPAHILEAISPADLRTSNFNTVQPIGTGAFKYISVDVLGDGINDRREKITLEANESYFKIRPQIDGISIRTYKDEETMIAAFEKKEIASMVGLNTVSENILADEKIQTFSTPLSGQVNIFFNNSTPILKNKDVRRALARATDASALRKSVGYQLVESDSPFLKSHFTYNNDKTQLSHNTKLAKQLLDKSGWKQDENGKRRNKKGELLSFRLVSQSLTEYSTIVNEIQRQWSALGITVDAVLLPEEEIQSGSVVRHDYDVLLYGIAIGPDPDVFAYWHSSQADPRLDSRLNLSEFKNTRADVALEGGRTRLDKTLREAKYKPFLEEWISNVPAIALYQPRFLFVFNGTLEGYQSGEFSSPTDRFYSINNWQIRLDQAIK